LTWQWIFRPAASHHEVVLMATIVMLAYALEGLFSSAFIYGPSNGLLVICGAWIWWQLRKDADPT